MHDDIGERLYIDGLLSPVAVQDDAALDLADHGQRHFSIHRRNADRDVLEHFGEDAAQAEEHGRPELRVPLRADDGLDPSQRHGLHDGVRRRVDVPGFFHDTIKSFEQALLGTYPDFDETEVAFMRDLIGQRLHDDRIADLLRPAHGLIRARDGIALVHGHVKARQQRLRFHFREHHECRLVRKSLYSMSVRSASAARSGTG